MGGKGYKSYTSLTGKKVSGDWEDSDRGAGNKATKRAGGKVEKKSPTYMAHVHNKEEVELKEYSPNLAHSDKSKGRLSKSSVYSLRDKDESKKSFRKSHVKDVKDGYVGKGHKPTPGNFKKEELIHPAVQNALDELNRYGKETGKATGSLNKRPGTPVKKGGTSSPVMQAVRTKIRQETGKPEGQQKKVRGDKSSTETTPVDRIKKSLADKRAAQKDPSQGRYPKG